MVYVLIKGGVLIEGFDCILLSTCDCLMRGFLYNCCIYSKAWYVYLQNKMCFVVRGMKIIIMLA